MNVWEVIPYKVYVHPEKDYKVSIYGAYPGEGWEVKQMGFTVFNNHTNTSGCGRIPWTNREDAQKWVDEQNERFSNHSASQ